MLDQHSPLPNQVRADMFAHLAAMEKAGLSASSAFSLLRLPANLQARVLTSQKMISNGVDISTAGLRSGLFSTAEASILRAAFSAGSPEITYTRLATRYAHKARQASLIKSRMALPLLVLLIALAVQPLPALVAGLMSVTGYLFLVARPFVVLAGLYFLYRFIASRLFTLTNHPTSIQVGLSVMLIHIPLFGMMLVRHAMRDFVENLALMLEAGMPMFDALPKAVDTVTLCVIRTELSRIKPKMEQGMTLSQALSDVHFQGHGALQSLVQTGEGSGTLPEMLLRFADAESDAIAQFQTQVAQWLPRFFYAIIMVWMAYQILHQRVSI